MTASDLMALVPWLVFAAGLIVVYLRLRKSSRASGDAPPRPGMARSRRPGPPQQPPQPQQQRPAQDDALEGRPAGHDQQGTMP